MDKRTCDWTEVKPGEVFIVHKQTKAFESIGMYQPVGTPLTIEAGYVKVFGTKDALVAHPSNPKYDQLNYYGPKVPPKQEVEVVDPKGFGAVRKFATISAERPCSMTGSDPEIFVTRGVKNSLLPAFKFLPTQKDATKDVTRPKNAYDYGVGPDSTVYRDGFAAEYYVRPVACHAYLVDYIRDGLIKVEAAAKKFDATAKLTIKNTFTVPATTMAAAKDEDVAFGCMPSLHAYGDKPNLPTDARGFKLRFAGGHVHLGGTFTPDAALEVVKSIDIVAAIPAVAIFAHQDSPVRRQFYGRAGEYRTPKHGIEYRTLSNGWLAGPAITHLMLNLVRAGARVGLHDYRKYFGMDEEQVKEIINFCDVKTARAWLAKHEQIFMKLITSDGVYTTGNGALKAWQMITQGGLEEIYPDPDDIPKNWLFTGTKWATHSEGPKCDWGKVCRATTA